MDRRQFLLGAGAVIGAAFAGCSRGSPPPAAGPSPLASTASAAASPVGPALPVSAGQTAAERVARAVAVEALLARGFAGSPAALPGASAFDITAALDVGTAAFAIAFAGTMRAGLSPGAEPVAPDDLMAALAGAVRPEASLLSASPADGRLVWAVASGASGLDELSGPGWRDRVAVVPEFALDRADGLPGLQAVYGAKLAIRVVDDPVARRAAILADTAAIGAFRACDAAELDGLGVLDDPVGFAQADPMVVLFAAPLADDQPDAVLAVDGALRALGGDPFVALERAVAAGGDPQRAAQEWVAANVP